MRVTRLVLVVILLGTVTSSGFAQLLPRRRAATQKAIEEAAMNHAAKWVGEMLGKEIVKMVDEFIEKEGHFLELQSSIQLFAEIQMDPQAKKWIESSTDRDSREAALKNLMDTGSASVFLSETAKFAEKLRNDKFSSPVLEKIYLEYECDGDYRVLDNVGKYGKFSTWMIHIGDFLERKDLPKERRDRRSITCYEKQRPKDPKNKMLLTVHCSLEFKTQRESKEFLKTLSFDLYLEDLKKVEGTKCSYPWKVKNVQYK